MLKKKTLFLHHIHFIYLVGQMGIITIWSISLFIWGHNNVVNMESQDCVPHFARRWKTMWYETCKLQQFVSFSINTWEPLLSILTYNLYRIFCFFLSFSLSLSLGNNIFLLFFSFLSLGNNTYISIKEHNIYIEPKFYKIKLLGKLVIQHGVRS